ncbi:MAG: hypothetical protein F6K26_16575 [Moorea sp. SIO2I5]|nr:hypothetical protein [Moorena sp. SIO2I5]
MILAPETFTIPGLNHDIFITNRLPIPDSRFPTPYSLHPTPDSRLPTPDSLLPIWFIFTVDLLVSVRAIPS